MRFQTEQAPWTTEERFRKVTPYRSWKTSGRANRNGGKRFGVITVTGHADGTRRRGNLQQYTADQRRQAMAIDWMTNDELSQAIPPPYAEFIGRVALQVLAEEHGIHFDTEEPV